MGRREQTVKTMASRIRFWMFSLLALSSISVEARTEQVVWDASPILLQLQVEKEQIVRFPDSVQIALPPELQGVLSIQAANDSLYITAHREFPKKRVFVRSVVTGTVYLFDVFATFDLVPDRIVRVIASGTDAKAYTDGESLTYVRLTRYAAQQLFAPARLLRPLPGVSRYPVSRKPVRLVRGWHIEARPLAAWKTTDLHVTAVELINLGSLQAELHPEWLRGHWKTAALHRFNLDPAGGEHDRTVAYLVSTRPFETASRASELEP